METIYKQQEWKELANKLANKAARRYEQTKYNIKPDTNNGIPKHF